MSTTSPTACTFCAAAPADGAAQLVRVIIANHDEQAHTAHDIAAETQGRGQLPDRAARLLDPALMLYGVGDTPTGTWWTRSRIRSPSGSAGSTSTSTAAKVRASITVSTS